jgi:hypothetical protein
MSGLQYLLTGLAASALGYVLWRRMMAKAKLAAAVGTRLFADVMPLLSDSLCRPGESAGAWKLTGTYRGAPFQFHAVVDTLALRKLPSLWLLVTLPRPQPLTATIDLMMRPAGQSSFSRFDFLPHTLPLPAEFPVEAVIRTDVAGAGIPVAAMRHALPLFKSMRIKELLLSPKGLRLVIQAAQADRARYGVLREARFDETHIDPSEAAQLMDILLAIEEHLGDDSKTD